ncbi:MAG: hypothetical protein WCJ64_02105 [Rhodospirillaceae bacterium]
METANWGNTVLSKRSGLEAIEVLTETGVTPDIVIANYRLLIICTDAEVTQHILHLFSLPYPGILLVFRRSLPARREEARRRTRARPALRAAALAPLKWIPLDLHV